ncbi:MAG: M20/M25/M40 family metallo-hydrolase [Treponema sp.]|jgi:endoglucanase|nr:M20/M25/M40 family metallo-hydrolase [Treponema sp.]
MTAQEAAKLTDGPLAKSLAALDNAFGVSGNEEEAAAAFYAEMSAEGGLFDERFSDALGNQFYVRYGKSHGTAGEKRLMFAAHLDEIGFVIKYIEDEGFARIFPVGYHDERLLVNQDLVFNTIAGQKIRGVTGAKPFHCLTSAEKEKTFGIADVYVDFGTESAGETRALGLEIGDLGGYARAGFFLNGTDVYSGKAVDDRAGLAVLVEALRRLKGLDIFPDVCVVATTQEEVGMRAGGVVTNRWKPDEFFALDVTLTGGAPGLDYRDAACKMGGGVCVKCFDWDPVITCGNSVSRALTARMTAAAKKHSIPFQYEVLMGGGTDGWTASLANCGTLAGGISIPSRYIHTAVGAVTLRDLDYCAAFVSHYVQDYR